MFVSFMFVFDLYYLNIQFVNLFLFVFRIPRQCELDQKGYLEDRRPAANCDPYAVTSIIAKTTILGNTYTDDQNAQDFLDIH